MTPHVEVIKPGLFTTIQDAGRWGWQARGVSVAGPMDPFAMRVANALVGNDRSTAVLEITLTGPELLFSDARVAAVSGARFSLFVNDQPVVSETPFLVPAGARLRFGQRQHGARAYLAINGSLDVAPVLNSRATHVPSGFGGWCGRHLAAADRLPMGDETRSVRSSASRDVSPRIGDHRVGLVRTPTMLRVLAGPDSRYFGPDALETLQAQPYRIHADSNRIGYRLAGATIRSADASVYVSDVTPIGTLQVPPSGQPILLMADRQTTGGYPRLATVISADIGAAGQAAPGDTLTFEVCTMAAARDALRDLERRVADIEASR